MGMTTNDDAGSPVSDNRLQGCIGLKSIAEAVGGELGHVVVAHPVAQEQLAEGRVETEGGRQRLQKASTWRERLLAYGIRKLPHLSGQRPAVMIAAYDPHACFTKQRAATPQIALAVSEITDA